MPIILGQLLLVAIIGYLWGSIPAGYWMGQLLRGKDFDIRNYGSHKTGATNVLRTLGRWPAAIVFVVDLSKGLGPTLLAMYVPFLHILGARWLYAQEHDQTGLTRTIVEVAKSTSMTSKFGDT